MKYMQITFHSGADFPELGRRAVPAPDGKSMRNVRIEGEKKWLAKSSSRQIEHLIADEVVKGRTKWAQLIVELDGIELYFWTPAELDHVCDIFAECPFPTAKTLVHRDGCERRLNGHWLSRLPKAAKAEKFRRKFLNYVNSNPAELLQFRKFYAEMS